LLCLHFSAGTKPRIKGVIQKTKARSGTTPLFFSKNKKTQTIEDLDLKYSQTKNQKKPELKKPK